MATSAQLIYFSPTGTTKRVLSAIAEGMGASIQSSIDITLPTTVSVGENAQSDIVLIGVPVYCGRVPDRAVQRLRDTITGNGQRAVLVAVYGNRAYEDALLELEQVSTELGYVPFSAAAFIGEHSFSTEEKPIAANRPDEQDLRLAKSFGRKVQAKLEQVADGGGDVPALKIPGNTPYRDGCEQMPISPESLEGCALCGECMAVCPTNAILEEDDAMFTNSEQCILCCACVRACPAQVRVMKAKPILGVADMLYTQHSERKEPEFFV